jgi:branched-chain amino acid aminotransferase
MKDIKITRTQESRLPSLDFNNIPFGKIASDHMFTAEYENGAWKNYQIRPVENLSLHPSNLALHYGQSIFEGMKASITKDGVPMLLRPEMHARRFNASAERMCMPTFPEEDFVEILKLLIGMDKDWIPPITGSAMYIRPLMFAADAALGVKASDTYQFVVLTLPVGPYYSKPVKLFAETKYVRAVEGGVGEAKTAGNYAASLYPTKKAIMNGYDQVLWLDSKEFKYIHEVGTMNIFFVFNENEVVTPAINGCILKGITRDTAIQLLREKGYSVTERDLSIDEVAEAYDNGTLTEVFGSGTAALVAHIEEINYKGKRMFLKEENWGASEYVRGQINGLRDGTIADTHGWTVPIKEPVLA